LSKGPNSKEVPLLFIVSHITRHAVHTSHPEILVATTPHVI